MGQMIGDNLSRVQGDIRGALDDAGRPLNACRLIAVSKGQPVERVEAALRAGHRIFGENRVQEAEAKWPTLRQAYKDVELHLIGPLQTNKISLAVKLFDVIQTLDRPKLARKLVLERDRQGALPRLYVQVNTGAEEQKAGVESDALGPFLELCRETLRLDVDGLMCIPPIDQPAGLHFAFLKKLAGEHGVDGLSMGMSRDYALAATLGASLVRVGTAIFGTRAAPQASG